MKKKIFFSVVIFSIIATTSSCREELVVNESAQNEAVISEGSVKNGRLYFPNKESLTYAYDKVKDKEDEVIADYVDSKDIISLRPIVTEKNEAIIGEKLEKRITLLKANERYMASKGALNKIENEDVITDDIDDLEEIIGDDAYSAFLDSRAEIQVADQIYKYTDVGLFIVQDSKYDELKQYLEVKEISDDLMYATEDSVKEAYIESQPSGEKVVVEDGIEYFNAKIAPIDPEDGGGGGGTSGGGTGNPPINDPNVQMVNFINGLQNCAPTNGLFDGLFGDSDICKDQYESRYRVKTKAYNYNYYLVYNLGVKVKHQYKGWTGIWRKENAEQIRLGVIYSEFTYDYTSYFQYPSTQYKIATIYNNNNRYMFDATTYWSANGLQITGYSTQGFPKILQDDFVIEQFGGNGLLGQGVNAAIQAGNAQLTSQNLSKLFWTETIPKLGEWWNNLGKPAPDPNNITLLYKTPELGKVKIVKALYRNSYNSDKLEKSFDWGFQIGFNLDPTSGNINPDTSGSALKKPQNFRVTMYGIAKRNGQWHGSKINTAN